MKKEQATRKSVESSLDNPATMKADMKKIRNSLYFQQRRLGRTLLVLAGRIRQAAIRDWQRIRSWFSRSG